MLPRAPTRSCLLLLCAAALCQVLLPKLLMNTHSKSLYQPTATCQSSGIVWGKYLQNSLTSQTRKNCGKVLGGESLYLQMYQKNWQLFFRGGKQDRFVCFSCRAHQAYVQPQQVIALFQKGVSHFFYYLS